MKNSVLSYLETTVSKYPDKLALSDENMEITFLEWKKMALCIADEIHQKTDHSHVPVFIFLPKSVMTLVSFAGILYSGNYYTPTDVKFPFEKVNSIIQCLHPDIILTDYKSSKKLLDGGIDEKKLIYLEDIDFSSTDMNSDRYLDSIIDTDLAYVLFTSGSTGIPKGVSITHRSIIDYIDWVAEEFGVSSNTIIGNQAPFYFDNSILDIYLSMSQGAHLYIIPEMYFSFTAKLLMYIVERQINFIFWVPSALIGVANSGLLEQIDCSCLKKILFCGEVMPNRHLNIWRRAVHADVYANLYGPTEITDVCAYYIVNRDFSDDDPLPIGKACRNTQIVLLDKDDQLITDSNNMGELCVRGTSLSVGYYDNVDKTEAAFVQNPLHNHYREMIYRTGDLAHYNEYGELMFDGRKDFQIKHMGYRIELGEIETAILSIPDIENACCIYDKDANMIVAFCKTTVMEETAIKKALLTILPKYMIPARYVLLQDIPYNDNGKIDRKTLKNNYLEERNHDE